MTVLHVNQIRWCLCCASAEEGPVAFAAAELRKYLRAITGQELSVTRGGDASSVILLGLRKDLLPADQALLPPPAEGFDGYSLSVIPGSGHVPARIVLGADNERATVYAVYDLLERVGCRWFYPTLDEKDPEVLARRDQARIEPGQWAVASPFEYRVFVWASFQEKTSEDLQRHYDWALKCRYNTVDYSLPAEAKRRGLMCSGGGHSFGDFLKTEDYFQQHPEWFGMQNGKRQPHVFGGSQFCWSNANARRTFADNFENYIRDHLDLEIFSLVGGDGLPACSCPECQRLHPADWEILLVNEVQERVAGIAPTVKLMTAGAYAPVEDPPIEIRPDPRLLLTWAHWGRHHGMAYDEPHYDHRENLDTWCQLFEGRIVPFQYYSDHFAEPWVAAPYASTIDGDRRYLIDHQATGFSNLMYPPGYWWNWGLNNYLAGLCFYDASADPFVLIRDYATKYFGEEAGELMGTYYDEWARNLDLAYHVRGDATDTDRAALARQRNRYLEPALAAAKDSPVLLYRLAKAEKLHALAERLMRIHGLRQESEQLRLAGDFPQAKERIAEAQKSVDQTASFIQSLMDLNQGLVDPELLNFYYPRIRAAVSQEAEAVDQGVVQLLERKKKEPSAADQVPPH